MSGARHVAPRAGASVPSPCIDVCRMDDASGLCAGCWRTLDEIAAWSALDDDAKRVVWQTLAERKARAAAAAAQARDTPDTPHTPDTPQGAAR